MSKSAPSSNETIRWQALEEFVAAMRQEGRLIYEFEPLRVYGRSSP
jgi:hypothetical protein